VAYNVVHVWFSDSQLAALKARSAMEFRTMSQIVKNAAVDYCAYGPITRAPRPPKPVVKLLETIERKDGPNEGL
jgi:hypothetical protein